MTTKTANKNGSTEAALKADLEDLKKDLRAVKEDISKVSADAYEQGKETANALKEQAGEQIDEGVNAAREYVAERPLTCAAVAAGVGLVAGALLAKS